jgi:hypothetical protein
MRGGGGGCVARAARALAGAFRGRDEMTRRDGGGGAARAAGALVRAGVGGGGRGDVPGSGTTAAPTRVASRRGEGAARGPRNF